MKIIKRNGAEETFRIEKIVVAITKANNAAEEAERLTADKAYLESVYKDGAQKASYLAEKTLRKVYKKVGFVAR